jgi:hypothetical protein
MEDRKKTKVSVKSSSVAGKKEVAKIRTTAGKPDAVETVTKWWFAPAEQAYQHINEVVKSIQNQQAARKDANARWLRLYTNFAMMGFFGGVYSRLMPAGSFANRNGQFTYNVVESCIDAVSAKISKSRPAPKMVPNTATFKQKKKAKATNTYLATMFDRLDSYERGQEAFTDACIFGTGLVKVYVEDSRVKLDRVLVNDIVVDEQDGMQPGGPRQLHQDTHIDRDVLIELYPDYETELRDASGLFLGQSVSLATTNMVAVRESWHLPSADGAGDGCHVICTSNATLLHEQWDHPWFPFAVYRWKPFIGWHGTGLAQQLTGIQIEIHKLTMLIAMSVEVNCKPTVWVPMEADVVAEQIGDDVGVAVRYSGGTTPTFVNPNAQPAEVYQLLQDCFDKAYSLSGISQMQAQSMKPPGDLSGAALRAYADIDTVRFELQEQRFEKFYCDVAKLVLAMSKQLYDTDEGRALMRKDKHFASQMDDIDFDAFGTDVDEFEITMFPVSSLPDDPSGRMQSIEDWIQAGYIDRANAMDLLNIPDLQEYISIQVAGIDNARSAVDKIRWEATWVQPDALMDLNTCTQLAQAAWLEGQDDGTPPNNLDMLARFINACHAKQQEMNPPAPPPAPAPSAPPQGRPGALPVSNLMPRVTPTGQPLPIQPQ